LLNFGYERLEVCDRNVEVLSEESLMLMRRIMSLQVGDLSETGETFPGAFIQANPAARAMLC
jgi:hypothetical protein